jgi:D-alanine-D-alanine ligase
MANHRINDAAAFGRVAVLMGGWSAEREVSLKSGQAVLQALLSHGVDAVAVDVQRDVMQTLNTQQFDRAFIILHGRGGEDGVIQGALELMGLPYTGSGVLGSALGMDKLRCKQLWQGAGLATPDFRVVQSASELSVTAQALGLPLMIKPAHEGSSIGMSKVTRVEDLPRALVAAHELDDCIIAERFIEGEEYTVAVLGDEALPAIRLETPREFYDYEAKYLADSTRYHCPCGLPAEQEQQLQALALSAFHTAAASGWGRVDMMVDHSGKAWLIEINTVPGMTDHSLVPMAAKQAGMDFEELTWRILETSVVAQ